MATTPICERYPKEYNYNIPIGDIITALEVAHNNGIVHRY
jgi:hypothetical protein